MASLAEYRAKYPQYDDLSDEQLADGLHAKYYSDMPKEDFYSRLGMMGNKPKMDRGTAAAFGVADAASFNNTDEFGAPLVSGAMNLIKGDLGGAAHDAARAFGGLDVLGMINPAMKPIQDIISASTKPSETEQTARRVIQDTQAQALKDRPATYIGSQVAATMAVPSAATQRGLNWGARTGFAALEGASLGGKYAEGAAPDDEKGDLGRIAAGVGFGAAGGATGAQLAPALSWAGKTAANALQISTPKFNPNQTNSLFGALDNSTPVPRGAPRSTVRQGVRDNVVKSAVRSGLTPENIGERVQPWRETGADPLTAQALGEPGLQRAQTLASLTGKTPQLAADTIKGVRDKSPVQILDAVNESFPITTRMKAKGAIDEGFKEASATYNKVLDAASDEQVAARMNEIAPLLQRMPDEVITEAQGVMERLARYDGIQPNQMNLAQQLHYFKRALGQAITGMKRQGLQADEARSLTRLAAEYTKKLDEVIPGYQPVRARWGDLSEAEEALAWSDDFFGKARPDELKAAFDEMTPFQKENALIGIANELKRRIASSTKQGVRKKNIAEQFINDEFANKLRSVLGDGEAQKLVKVLNLTDRDFNELSSLIPRGNSKTISVFGDMIDQAQAAPPVNKRDLLELAAVPFRYGWNKATNALLESSRNKEGAEMFSTFTPEKQTALEEALRQYYSNRSAATRAAARGGNAGGVAGGSAAGQQ